MADADIAITAGAGTKVDTRTVGAGTDEHRQVVCLGDPTTAANVALIDATFGVDVDVTRLPATVISTANSTTSVLAGAAVFTGTSEDVSAYAVIFVNVFASHASATDGLSLQQSSNGTNWDHADVYTIPAASGKVYAVNPACQFFRVVYTNGGTLQTSFRLQTIYKRFMSRPSSNRPSDAYTNETDTDSTQAFLQIYNGTTWDRARGDTTNGIDVDVTRSAPQTAATSTVTNTAASATNVTLKASNTARKALYIFNAGTSNLFVKLGTTATATTSFTYMIPPNGLWELPDDPIYTGIVDGIWTATGGSGANVTELT